MEHSPTLNEWIERYERQQEVRNGQIDALSQNVSALTADVRNLMKNQESLFSKTSRPFQWSAFIAAISLGVAGLMLVIVPMKEEMVEQNEFDKNVMEYMMKTEFKMGAEASDKEWFLRTDATHTHRINELEEDIEMLQRDHSKVMDKP